MNSINVTSEYSNLQDEDRSFYKLSKMSISNEGVVLGNAKIEKLILQKRMIMSDEISTTQIEDPFLHSLRSQTSRIENDTEGVYKNLESDLEIFSWVDEDDFTVTGEEADAFLKKLESPDPEIKKLRKEFWREINSE